MTEEEKKIASEETKKAEEAAALVEKEKIAESKDTENMIPQARLNEVISERNKLRDRISDIETKQAEAEKKSLEEKGEYKVLAEKLQKEKEDLITQNINANKRMAVLAKLSMPDMKARDTEVIMKLIDFNSLKVDEDGIVTDGLDEQIKKLKEDKAYLFSTGKITDTDETNSPTQKPGEIDWAVLAQTLPREEYRKKYYEVFGMYPPNVL